MQSINNVFLWIVARDLCEGDDNFIYAFMCEFILWIHLLKVTFACFTIVVI